MDFIKNWLPALSVIISAVVSWTVALIKSKTELRKLKFELAHQDKSEFALAFADLMSLTSLYCFSDCQDSLSKAIHASAKLMALSPKDLAPVVNEMHTALNDEDVEAVKHLRNRLATTLSDIIQRM